MISVWTGFFVMNESIYQDVRIWQSRFSVLRALSQLPVPEIIVEEKQNHPSYRWDGRSRFEDGSQVVITLAGEGGIKISGTEHVLLPGKAFLHNHNDPGVCYYYPSSAREEWRFLWFAFYGANTAEMVKEINERQGYLFDLTPNGELVKLLMMYKNYSGIVQQISPLEGAQLVFKVLELLCSPASGNDNPCSHAFIVNETENMIIADPSAELKVAALAKHFQISREHLSRVFREETGMPLHEYIIRFRLRLAIDLLRHSQLSIKEIAIRCGWHDYSNFYRIFSKRFDRTPQEFREGVSR